MRSRWPREAVAITNHGRESVVPISAAEYERYRALDERRAEYVWEIPDDEAKLLAQSGSPAEAEAFNGERARS